LSIDNPIYLTVNYSGFGVKEAVQRYEEVSYNAVGKASSRFYERFKKDRKLNRKIKRILSNVQMRPLSPSKTDIRNAVNAGKVVTVSKTNITYNGWTGCGYIIIDPDTGAGAYMISGGMSGGWLMIAIGNALILLGFISSEFGIGIGLLLLGILYVAIGLCLIYSNAEILEWSLAAVNTIIGAVFTIIPGAGAFIASSIISLITTIGGVKAAEDIKKFCKGE
jgi:hypothetical protein